jgi:hypothetical protein
MEEDSGGRYAGVFHLVVQQDTARPIENCLPSLL